MKNDVLNDVEKSVLAWLWLEARKSLGTCVCVDPVSDYLREND